MSSLDRRDLVRFAFLGGVWVMVGENGLATLAFPSDLPSSAPFELEEAGIAALQEAMKAGRATSVSLVEGYTARIALLDRDGPALNGVIEFNPDALSIAAGLDAERRAKGPRGPLHGIPILIKDNIDTADRMATTAGSLALAGAPIPASDAAVASRLRAAGAVILGKTNLSEWANFRSTHSVSGWSARGGQTRNPYALDRNPCGSSSGSGTAVAACLAAAAVGTETDGSIVCPASSNGIVGIKPTVGLLGRSGIIPISHTQDTAGPMARTVTDAAILLSVLTGYDPRDAATTVMKDRGPLDYTTFLDPSGLRGARIGVVRRLFGYNERVDALMASCLDVMKGTGAVLVDPVDAPSFAKLDGPEMEVLLYEFKADLNAYLASRGPGTGVRTLKDLIAFNEKNCDREMPLFGQELFIEAEARGPLTDSAYRSALKACRRLSRRKGIDAVMEKHRLDALVAPTGGIPWLTDPLNGDHFTGGCSTPAAVAGYPHVTVPAGFIWGLPIGISFFGRAFSEPTLIRLAYAFEQATHSRRSPDFRANAGGAQGPAAASAPASRCFAR
jgi:amidase